MKYLRAQYTNPRGHQQPTPQPTTTSFLYRPMRFLPTVHYTSPKEHYSGIPLLEQYIDQTKRTLDEHLPSICSSHTSNLTERQHNALTKLRKTRKNITIKPADKNLGIVLMDTDDYITQCTTQLSNTETYRQAPEHPTNNIRKQLQNTLVKFKEHLQPRNKALYKYLTTNPKQPQTPRFYGIPKIHKHFTRLPPMRPIVSHSNSILTPTAHFIDHVLQPLARSYPDYLHNSTSLTLTLQNLQVPDNAILVSIDVESLYPSIPQSECLEIIYTEMHDHQHLLIFDPNLIIHLLHTNINYNYFEFANYIFQQIKGTAMGAAFSPTIANIFMSVILRQFLRTQQIQPLIILRYIDDIFMIWPDSTTTLQSFLTALNSFHPNLHFTHQQSEHTIDFLDLTIYKGQHFTVTNLLDTKTFQKPQNLYQYLHYHSNHPKAIYKALIRGECIRYVRTNTTQENYLALLHLFKQRLLKRQYPLQLVDKWTAIVKFHHRQHYLQSSQPSRPIISPPIFKCMPPPQYKLLKQIVLHQYTPIQGHLPAPRFIALRHRTLHNELVRAICIPTDEQLIDIALILASMPITDHITAGKLPHLHTRPTTTIPCRHPRCSTCKQHLSCAPTFKSTRTGTVYPIRHSFSCTSTNLIYLITRTKCKKQYVGLTTQQLNTRLNHHRTNILTNQPIYLCVHFNFPDHSLQHLQVQPIDCPTDSSNTLHELRQLEKFWIKTLRTAQPQGLNNSLGFTSI